MEYKIKSIAVEVIPHSKQRYDTEGDYQMDEFGNVLISISNYGDPLKSYICGEHERAELLACAKKGITFKQIDEFDLWYLENKKENDPDEPGDHPNSPYYEQHQMATQVERDLCKAHGLDWDEYYNSKPLTDEELELRK